MITEQTKNEFWSMLHRELEGIADGAQNAPLLAHYTSLVNLENILRSEQVWLSNPLYMNDLEEVRFGVNRGRDLVISNDRLRLALGGAERVGRFYGQIDRSYNHFANNEVLDLYLMCFSDHSKVGDDGLLSMWRGYGANGKGAAIVFDVSSVNDTENSPFVLAPVQYATQDERLGYITAKIHEAAEYIAEQTLDNEDLAWFADALLRRIILYAVFSKHIGFEEEKEWRFVYFKDRDGTGQIDSMMSYFSGPNGMQPKLKLDVKRIPGVLSENVQLDKIIDRIIIGPTVSSPLSKLAAERMLQHLEKEGLRDKIRMSSIPFRET